MARYLVSRIARGSVGGGLIDDTFGRWHWRGCRPAGRENRSSSYLFQKRGVIGDSGYSARTGVPCGQRVAADSVGEPDARQAEFA